MEPAPHEAQACDSEDSEELRQERLALEGDEDEHEEELRQEMTSTRRRKSAMRRRKRAMTHRG